MVLIPYPKKLTNRSGSFHLERPVTILLDTFCDYSDYEAALLLKEEILGRTGITPAITKGAADMNKLAAQPAGMIILQKAAAEPGKISGKAGKTKMEAETHLDSYETPDPSYRLVVTEEMILVSGCSAAGLLYGVQTLRQIIRGSAPAIQCMEIEDRPDFEYRGFYHDITRGRVPKLTTLMELADRLSFYKINQLQLYIEHTFAFRTHSEIWSDSDPLTAEDILVLDEYCKKRGIELVPSISTFGHLYHALVSRSFGRLNEYEKLPEKPFTWVERMRHYTLDASNPQSLQFVRDMIDEYLPLFTSDKFNIGCDETFDLGNGRNKPLAESMGRGKLYLYFVREIVNYVKSQKKKVMMWGDILLKYPEVLKDLPEGVILLNWNYDPNAAEDGIRAIAEAGFEQYACPGVQGWNRLINDMDAANRNIAAMVSHGLKYAAKGILNTDWGDFGHINLLAGSMPGAIFGAGLSWNGDKSEGPSDEEISKLEYGDFSGRYVGLVRELSRQAILDWETTVLWYYSTTGLDVDDYGYQEHYLKCMLECGEDSVRKAYARIGELQDELAALNLSVYPNRRQDLREILAAAEGLRLSQALLLVIKKGFLGQKDTGLILAPQELAVKLEYWLMEYKRVWRERNRESELYRIKEVITGICRLLRG
ncbi:MAG TPA: family 20 glycosylhydrolase [Clostridia bacterium]|nr:family 20 glycosylhydrolase [Clostridia bacterium]